MSSVKKVLLCDAAFGAVPILRALKGRGYAVGVCGGRSEDPGHALADESFVFNYADVEQLAGVFKDHHYDAIVPGCTDVSYASSSQVANRFSLPGFDDLERLKLFQNKSAYRENLRRNHLSTPAFTYDPKETAMLNFPIVAKPTESFSGRGIMKIASKSELQNLPAIDAGAYLYEEFVEGKLYSHSAFIKNQSIVLDFFVNEYCTVYPYQVNSSNVSVSLDDALKGKIRSALEEFVSANQLCDGLVHTQLIANKERFWLIEAARRCPGDLYSLLIRYGTNIDYADLYAAGFCGKDIEPPACAYEILPVSRHTVSVKEECVFIKAQLDPALTQIDYVSLKKAGDVLKAVPYDRAGIYFIRHDSLSAMDRITPDLVHYVTVESAKS